MEFLDVVDEEDKVVGKAERNDIYERKLPHRIVHVLIFNERGEMALQKRSATVSFCPSHWSTAVGGHVMSGESYHQAALREFDEELGLTVPISFAFKDEYKAQNGAKKFISTFKATYGGPFDIDTDAVERVDFFSLDDMHDMIREGETFHPELLFLLEEHFGL
jgi:isopentenyldiphosphate isomerase